MSIKIREGTREDGIKGRSLGFHLSEPVGQWSSESRGAPRAGLHFSRITLATVRGSRAQVWYFLWGG